VARILQSRAPLDAATEVLREAYFDRAAADVVADPRTLRQCLGGVDVAGRDLADMLSAPRRPFFSPHDTAMHVALVAGTFATIGGTAVATWAAVSAARTSVALGAAAAAACAAVGLIAYLSCALRG
jgi:hypothetical protein